MPRGSNATANDGRREPARLRPPPERWSAPASRYAARSPWRVAPLFSLAHEVRPACIAAAIAQESLGNGEKRLYDLALWLNVIFTTYWA